MALSKLAKYPLGSSPSEYASPEGSPGSQANPSDERRVRRRNGRRLYAPAEYVSKLDKELAFRENAASGGPVSGGTAA